MKKFYAIALLGLMVLGMTATASAADIKATGTWNIEASLQNADFLSKGAVSEDKTFNIEQRMRTAFQFIANENLKGVLDLQIGTSNWGNGLYSLGAGRAAGTVTANQAPAGSGVGASNAAGNGNIMLRKAYLDFKWPGTKANFLVGFQTVALPVAFGGGSAIFDDPAAAAIVTTPVTDNVTVLAGYSRLFDSNLSSTATAGSLTGSGTSTDVAFAAVPIDFKGVNITPFAAYAYAGKDTYASGIGAPPLPGFASGNNSVNQSMRAYWGGVAATVTTLDNFKFMADFNYGKATYNNVQTANKGRSGWLADVAVDYTGLQMLTPSAFFVYSSGEKGNSTDGGQSGSNRMPVVGNPENWAVGSFFFGDPNFLPGSTGFIRNVIGFWTIGVSLKDIKLIDKFSHTAHVLYVKGTNDKRFLTENGGGNLNTVADLANYGGFLTTKDSLWEVDFNTKYIIYDELAVNLDLGYINANFDKDVWGASSKTNAADYQNYGSKDAYSARLGLAYSF